MWWAQSCSGLSDRKPRELQEVLTRDVTPFPSPAGHWKELCCKKRGQQPLATPHQCLGLPARGSFSLLYTKILELLLPISSPGRQGCKTSQPSHPHKKSCSASACFAGLQHTFPTLWAASHTRALGVLTTASSSHCQCVPASLTCT